MQSKLNYQPDSTAKKKKEHRQFHHFLLKVGIVYAVLSIILYFSFSRIMDDHAYEDISRDEIRQFSQMVFESSLTAMLALDSKQGIRAAPKRMERTGPGMTVNLIRGETVDELYGEDELGSMRRRNDLNIFDVFKNKKESTFRKGEYIRFLYPVLFQTGCLNCHKNAEIDQVSGVVEIIYPVKNPKVSTQYVNNLMLYYFISSFIVLIVFLSWSYRHDSCDDDAVDSADI